MAALRTTIGLLVVALGLSQLASAQPAPATSSAPAPKRTYTVAAIGDSLTDARSHGGKFLDYLRARCPESRFDNYGRGGEMVNQMRRRFARDVLGQGSALKPKYSHVIVFGGVNDLYSDLTAGRTPDKIERDLAAMYQLARENNMQVIALTIAPWGGFKRYFNASRGQATLAVNEWILQQPKAGLVDFVVDTYPMLSCGDPQRLCKRYETPFRDGLHFGPEAHQLIGEALFDKVFSDCR